MDVSNVLPDVVDVEKLGFDMNKMPSTAELLKMLEIMKNLPEEEKDNLKKSLLQKSGQSTQTYLLDDFTSQTLLLVSLLSLIALILGFFSYKVYKLLTDREKKREEKRKLKELKKKKK